jgi:hypothetical protein
MTALPTMASAIPPLTPPKTSLTGACVRRCQSSALAPRRATETITTTSTATAASAASVAASSTVRLTAFRRFSRRSETNSEV